MSDTGTTPSPRESWNTRVILGGAAFSLGVVLVFATVAYAFWKRDAGLIKNAMDWAFITIIAVCGGFGVVGGLETFGQILAGKK